MKAEYYLISKSIGKSYTKYRGDAISISETIPHTVDEVWVGIKKHPEKMRRITTFRNKDGDIIERAFDYSNGKLRNRLYRYDYTKISDKQAVKSTEIRDMYIKKKVFPFYEKFLEDYKETHPLKTILWNLTEITTNHFNWNKQIDKKVISQVKISNLERPTEVRHSFIEFPHIIKNKIQNTKKKILSFTVNEQTQKVDTNDIYTQNTCFPNNDSFLAQRALNIYECREPLTKRFLKERKLQDKNITIEPYYYPKNEDEKLYSAHFEPKDGSINFNRFYKAYSKSQVVSTSAHEAEHGFQYYLRARYKNPTTEWEKNILNDFGRIKDRKTLKQAKRYYKSIINYRPLSKELVDSNNEDIYRNAYIEKKSNKKGQKAASQYDREGKTIRNNFKYIPERFL